MERGRAYSIPLKKNSVDLLRCRIIECIKHRSFIYGFEVDARRRSRVAIGKDYYYKKYTCS